MSTQKPDAESCGGPCECRPLRGNGRDGGENCGAERDGFTCTRPAGHDGPHTACQFFNHPAKEWSE